MSGLTNAFPRESVALVAAARRGDWTRRGAIYRWFMPLLHLDAEHDLVQSIKLAEQIMGRGSERVRLPRYAARRRAPRGSDRDGREGRRDAAEARRVAAGGAEPMRHTFFCIDGHTAGNPVRLVAGGAPVLNGATMSERRQDFLARFDWIRTGLLLRAARPRHDVAAASSIRRPAPTADVGILFIETSGCLPMCGHGTIGIVTFALENGLIKPRTPGRFDVEVPAGHDRASTTTQEGDRVASVRIRNVPSYLAARGHRDRRAGLRPAHARRRLWRQFLRHHRTAGRLYAASTSSAPRGSSS